MPSDPFHVELNPPTITLRPAESGHLQVLIAVPAHHYLYRKETALMLIPTDGVVVDAITYPAPEIKHDAFLGTNAEIYPRDVIIDIALHATDDATAGARSLSGSVNYQGCSDALCFRRMTHDMSFELTIVGGASMGNAPTPTPSNDITTTATDWNWRSWLHAPDYHALAASSLWVPFVLTFLGGVLTSLTPCVLPIMPVVLLIIGVGAGHRRRNFALACSLTCGVALTYASIGLLTSLAGLPIAFLFGQRWIVGLIIIFYLLMALSMFGLFSLQLPHAWQQRLQHVGGRGPRGAFFAGISTGLLATPCAGPVVAALLAFVGAQHQLGFGFALLFTYGLGFGVLFIVVGTFYGELARRLPKGGLVRAAKILLGVLLLLPAAYYTWVLASPRVWEERPAVAFATAQAAGRPVMLEFTSKTCLPCLQMERTTFRDPVVLDALATRIVPLRFDMTFPDQEKLALAEKYQVVGWPTILFAAPDGTIWPDLTFVGKVVSADELLQQISTAEQRLRGAQSPATTHP